MITALFQKGPCSQYLMLHLAMCRPAGRPCLPHGRTDRRIPRRPDGVGRGRVQETCPGLCLPSCVRSTVFPCRRSAGLSARSGTAIVVVWTAASFLTRSHEHCIVIVVIPSLSYVPPWCWARGTLSFGMIGITSGICSSFGCVESVLCTGVLSVLVLLISA